QRRQLAPALAEIRAHVEVRRLGARIQPHLVPSLHVVEPVNVTRGDAVVPALPGGAAILAGVDAVAVGPGEDHAVARLDRERGDVLAAEHTSALLPRAARAGEADHAIGGPHQHLVVLARGLEEVPTVGGNADSHRLPPLFDAWETSHGGPPTVTAIIGRSRR